MQPEHDGPDILVADDDDALLRIHARALASKGYRVETAPDGYPCTDPALDGSRGVTHLQLRGVDPLGLRDEDATAEQLQLLLELLVGRR
jgi:CheY-like chemotaxis protein